LIIKDKNFCIKFCLRAILPTYEQTYQLLSYAMQLAQNLGSKTDLGSRPIATVCRAIRRLGTYVLLRGTLSLDSPDAWDGEDWQGFRMASMASEIREYLADGDVEGALLMWRRHHLGKRSSRNLISRRRINGTSC
jgi:hypothetical protein